MKIDKIGSADVLSIRLRVDHHTGELDDTDIMLLLQDIHAVIREHLHVPCIESNARKGDS